MTKLLLNTGNGLGKIINNFMSLRYASYYWLSNLDSSDNFLRICFQDFNKAFERINLNILMNKLLLLGVRKCLLPWLSSFYATV